MAKLPILAYPIHDVQLLSQKDPIKIRPFTVREEKLMLQAVEAKDLDTTVNVIKQIINNCVIGDFDVEKMAMVDMETLFLNLRARSVGEVGHQFFKCKNEIHLDSPVADSNTTHKECGMVIDVPINFLQIPILNQDTNLHIKFTDDVGIKMKFPTFALFKKLLQANPEEIEYLVAANCLDMIYDKDSSYNASDCTEEELMEFIMNLPTAKYDKIKEFCEKVPRTQLIVKKECSKCNYLHTFTLEGIEDFFV